jgi:branched-chain amino acid transport system permease protein
VNTTPSRARQGLTSATMVKLVLVFALALLFPMVAQRYQIGLVNNAMVLALGAIALNVLMGLAGLVSVGNAALFAIGAFGAATCARMGLPPLAGILLCTAVSAVLGLVVGLPALRVHGMYLAIATLALHFLVIFGLNLYQSNAVGPMGFVLPQTTVAGHEISGQREWYYVIFGSLAVVFWIVHNLRTSRFGRAWMLLRDASIAAASLGVDVARYKLLAFVFTSAIVGYSGALFAYYQQNVYIEGYSLELAIQYIAMIVIGGWGSTGGAIAGAFFVALMPTMLASAIAMAPRGSFIFDMLSRNVGDVQLIVYGGLIIGFLVLEPGGLTALYRRLERLVRRR